MTISIETANAGHVLDVAAVPLRQMSAKRLAALIGRGAYAARDGQRTIAIGGLADWSDGVTREAWLVAQPVRPAILVRLCRVIRRRLSVLALDGRPIIARVKAGATQSERLVAACGFVRGPDVDDEGHSYWGFPRDHCSQKPLRERRRRDAARSAETAGADDR